MRKVQYSTGTLEWNDNFVDRNYATHPYEMVPTARNAKATSVRIQYLCVGRYTQLTTSVNLLLVFRTVRLVLVRLDARLEFDILFEINAMVVV